MKTNRPAPYDDMTMPCLHGPAYCSGHLCPHNGSIGFNDKAWRCSEMEKYKTLRAVFEKYPNAYFIMYCGELYIEYGELKEDSPELDIEPSNGDVNIYEHDGVIYASFSVDSFFD